MLLALRLTATDNERAVTATVAWHPSDGEGFSSADPATGAGSFPEGQVVSAPLRHPAGGAWALSATAHAAVAAVLLLVPLLTPDPPLMSRDPIQVLIYDPPPPLPRPLARGSPFARVRPQPRIEAADRPLDTSSNPPTLHAPTETTPAASAESAPPLNEAEPAGGEAGADSGAPEGMSGGVDGGIVGGFPGGVLGGVISGTGAGVVPNFDRAPRLLRQPRPQYPQGAFVKRIEGTVVVEFIVGTDGHVISIRIVQSVPFLDAAALEAVREWVFAPALKHGVPVASQARAPVSFHIY